MTVSAAARGLKRRLARLEERLGDGGDAGAWLTPEEEQVAASLRRETHVSVELREVAVRALHLVAAERRVAGLAPPQRRHGTPPVPPEVIELMERARRELQLAGKADRDEETGQASLIAKEAP